MKKTLVALAAIAATSAFAQSSVTAYGVIDTAYFSAKAKSNASAAVTNSAGLTNSTLAGSRLGFKGTEDLGNGTKANFVAEMALNAVSDSFGAKSDGAANPAANKVSDSAASGVFNRQTWVGLSNAKAGEVRIGYMNGLQYDHNAPYSAGFEGMAGAREHLEILSGHSLATVNSATPAKSEIETNRMTGVTYFTPEYNGFKAAVQWGASKVEQIDGTAPSAIAANAKGSHQSIAAYYNQGPLSIGLTTGGSKFKQNTASNAFLAAGVETKTTVNAIGASYDLGMAKLYAYMGDRKTTSESRDEVKVKVNRIGVQVPMGSYKFIATMGHIKGQEDGVDVVKRKTKQIGALYSLSKRTTLFGLYGSDKDGSEMTGFTTAGAGNNAATTSTNTTTYRVGINHSF